MEHFMEPQNAVRAAIFAILAGTVTGCASNASQFAPAASDLPGAQLAGHNTAQPSNCTPAVWATSLQHEAVYGYTAANTAPCVSLHGTYNGLHFNQPHALAIGSNPNYLYVADMFNSRIVVFDYNGNYVKTLSTTLGNVNYAPWGICVSSQGVVGVGALQASSQQGKVEFFAPNAPDGSGPIGDATGQNIRQTYCAFDSAGNFFVSDGTDTGVSKIDYLASAYVGLPGQTLSDAGLGTAVWTGMYSRIDDPATQTLSVVNNANFSNTQTVETWTVSGAATGPLTFTPAGSSPYVLHHYPHVAIPTEQAAPSTGGINGTLYVGEYGKDSPQGATGKILAAPANGGAVTVYQHLRGVIGVATNPSGQY
jgi:hypothetical protein